MSSAMSVQYSSSSSADHSRYIASLLSTPEPEAAGGQRAPSSQMAKTHSCASSTSYRKRYKVHILRYRSSVCDGPQFVATEPAMAGHLRSAPSRGAVR